MDDKQLSALVDWIERHQGLSLTSSELEEPATVGAAFVARTGEIAAGIPFDSDPAGFVRALHDLAPDAVKTDE